MIIISEYSIDGTHPNQLTSAHLFIDVLVIHKYCNSSICAALVQKKSLIYVINLRLIELCHG